MTSGTKAGKRRSNREYHRDRAKKGRVGVASTTWMVPGLAAFVLWSFVILFPQAAHAQCPPAVDPASELDAVLNQCGNWVCDVTYDPSSQLLPNDPSLEFPWIVDMTWGATQMISNDKLVITFPDPSTIPYPHPTPGISGVNIVRYEPVLATSTIPVYAIQVRVQIEGEDPINMPDKRLFVIGTGDSEKVSTVSLGYYQGERIVALGEAGPDWDNPEFLPPLYTMPWDFENIETTYTLVVEQGVAIHVLVDGQPVLSRPWNTLPSLGGAFAGIFVNAHEGSLASSTTSLIHYCVCEPVAGDRPYYRIGSVVRAEEDPDPPQNTAINRMLEGMDRPVYKRPAKHLGSWSCGGDADISKQAGIGVSLATGEFNVSVRALSYLDRGDDCTDACCAPTQAPSGTLFNDFTFTHRSALKYSGRWGKGWDHNYGARIYSSSLGYYVLDGAGSIRLYRSSAIPGAYTPPPGIFRELIVEAGGSIKLRFRNGTIQTYHATDGSSLSGKLLSIIDKNDNSRTLEYDAQGLLSRVLDSFGRETVYTYSSDLLTAITDFSGRTATFSYDGAGNLVQITLPPVINSTNGVNFPNGVTYAFGYDSESNLLVGMQAPNEFEVGGQSMITNTYDGTGRVLEQYVGGTNLSGRPAGGAVEFSYSQGSGNAVTTVHDRNGNRLEYHFNPESLLVAKRDNYRGSGPSLEFSETTYAYDVEYNVIQVVHPLGNMEQSTYDAQSDDVLARGNQLRHEQIADAARGATHAVLVNEFAYEPVYQQITRIHSEKFFAPSVANAQCPTTDPSAFVETYLFDYQEDSGVNHVAALAAQRGVSPVVLEQRLIDQGVLLGMGDLNHDGALDQLSGNLVFREMPAVTLLSHLEQVKVEGDTTQRFVHKFRFDFNGALLEQEDQLSVVTSYNYDLFGRWTQKVVDSTATSRRSITYLPTAITFRRSYNAAGCLSEITDGRGVKRQLNYNALNRLESTVRDVAHVASANAGYGLTLPQSYITLYLHDANGNVVETKVENRNGWQLPAFPVGSYVSASTTFDILSQPIESTSRTHVGATPLTTRKYYDPNGNVVEMQKPAHLSKACSSQEFEYTSRNKMSIQFSARGTLEEGAIQFAYDENGNLVERRLLDANGITMRATQYIHDGHDRLVKAIFPNGTETSDTFDAHGLVVRRKTSGNNAQQQYVLLVKEAFCYDAQDRNTRHDRYLFLPDLTVGTVLLTEGSLTPDSGYLTEIIEYDAGSNLTFHHRDNGAVDSYKYDGMGRCRETVDALGNVVLQEYDGMGNTFKRTVVEKSALHGDENTFSDYQLFDAENRRTRFTDGENNTVYYDYDSLGNQVTVRYQNGNKTDDPFGLVEGEINEPGSEIRYYYDGLGRLRRMENYAADDASVGILTDFAYDANGNKTTIIDDNLNETLFEYDCRDRLVEKTNSDGTFSALSYNAASERTGFLDENGSQFSYTLNVDGSVKRLSVVGSSVGTTAQTFSYNGRGAMIRATDSNDADNPDDDVTTEFRLDSTGRIVEATRNGRTISADYHSDHVGPSRVSLPSGASVKLTLDTLRRPSTLTYVNGAEEQAEIARRFYYGPRRKLEKVVLGNNVDIQFSRIDGTFVKYGFDNNENNTFKQYVSTAKNKQLLKIERKYDQRQNIVLEKIRNIRRTSTKPYGKVRRKISYEYDSVRRLSSYTEKRSAGQGDNSLDEMHYNMDGVGNRTSVVANSQTTLYTTDEMNQYQFVGSSENVYDDNGNMVQRGQSLDLQWDALNRLVVAQRPDGTIVRFAYDAFGNRASRTVTFASGAQSHWAYLHFDRMLYEVRELDSASGVVLNHVEILNQLALDNAPAIVRNGEVLYLMKGKNQNVLGLMDSAGNVVESYRYNPFGGMEAFDEEGNAIVEPLLNTELLFQSRSYDKLLEMYNFRRRWYDAKLGRFVSRDPKLMDKFMNQNAFAFSNPNSYMDALGEMAHGAIVLNYSCTQVERNAIRDSDRQAEYRLNLIWSHYMRQGEDGNRRCGRNTFRYYYGCRKSNANRAWKRRLNKVHWRRVKRKFKRLKNKWQSGYRYYRCGNTLQCTGNTVAVAGADGAYIAICQNWQDGTGLDERTPPYYFNSVGSKWSSLIHEAMHGSLGIGPFYDKYTLRAARNMSTWKRRKCPFLYELLTINHTWGPGLVPFLSP